MSSKKIWQSPKLAVLGADETATGVALKAKEDPYYHFYGPTTS
jgi:hypothetical protein